MNNKNAGRCRFVGLRLTAEEFNGLRKSWEQSTAVKLSEYLRRVLFGKRVTVRTRNISLDELMAELLQLRKELNAIGVNINQATHKLHMADRVPQLEEWLVRWDRDKTRFFSQVDQIVAAMAKVEERWLQ